MTEFIYLPYNIQWCHHTMSRADTHITFQVLESTTPTALRTELDLNQWRAASPLSTFSLLMRQEGKTWGHLRCQHQKVAWTATSGTQGSRSQASSACDQQLPALGERRRQRLGSQEGAVPGLGRSSGTWSAAPGSLSRPSAFVSRPAAHSSRPAEAK